MSYDSLWHDRNEKRFKRIEESQERLERQSKEILARLRGLATGEEEIMSQQDDINATAAQEEADLASIAASQASFEATAKSALDEITALEQQIANNPGQPAASLDLTAAKQAAQDLHTAAQALASAATTEAADTTAATTTTTPTDPTGGGTTTDPTTDPTGGGTTAASVPDQPVYTYSGGGTPADPAWNPAPFLTADGQQLYYFASDSPGSAANGNGLGGVWAVYDATQGVQAASSGGDAGTPTNEPSAPGTTS